MRGSRPPTARCVPSPQFLLSYYFVMSIVGMAIYLAGYLYTELEDASAESTLVSRARSVATCSCGVGMTMQLVALALIIAGVVLEVTLGQLGAFVYIGHDYLLIAKVIGSFVFNTVLSRLVTVMIATKVWLRCTAAVPVLVLELVVCACAL